MEFRIGNQDSDEFSKSEKRRGLTHKNTFTLRMIIKLVYLSALNKLVCSLGKQIQTPMNGVLFRVKSWSSVERKSNGHLSFDGRLF